MHGRAEDGPGVNVLDEYFDDIGSIQLLTAQEEVILGRRIRAGLDATEELASDPYIELQRLASAGAAAKRELILANLRLVVHWAKPYSIRTGVDLLDLVQDGSLGLIRAAEKFDHTLGYKFCMSNTTSR